MDFGLFCLGLGIAIAGYCIGDGLKNFKNPNDKNLMDYLDEDSEHELIKQKDVHNFIGISKEDAEFLIEEHTDIPHITINDKVYYPKEKLRKWLLEIGG